MRGVREYQKRDGTRVRPGRQQQQLREDKEEAEMDGGAVPCWLVGNGGALDASATPEAIV